MIITNAMSIKNAVYVGVVSGVVRVMCSAVDRITSFVNCTHYNISQTIKQSNHNTEKQSYFSC